MEDIHMPDVPNQSTDSAMENGGRDSCNDESRAMIPPAGEVPRTNIQLEDLFNDVDSNEEDEISVLGVSKTNHDSSPQETQM